MEVINRIKVVIVEKNQQSLNTLGLKQAMWSK